MSNKKIGKFKINIFYIFNFYNKTYYLTETMKLNIVKFILIFEQLDDDRIA